MSALFFLALGAFIGYKLRRGTDYDAGFRAAIEMQRHRERRAVQMYQPDGLLPRLRHHKKGRR